MEKVVIIGAGIGGLATACILGKAGYDVTVIEKNSTVGGRASVLKKDEFIFDMGPSWYLMPDIFENFYSMLDESIEEHLTLKKLAPSYRIFFAGENEPIDIYGDVEKDGDTFEKIEPGSKEQLRIYLQKAKEQYQIARDRFIYKNYRSIFDFFTWETMTQGTKLHVFQTMDRYVRKFFSTDKLQKIMQYTLVFLGSSPYNTPALYSIMSHVDFNMGVFYPEGGIYEIIRSLRSIAKKHGVTIITNTGVRQINTKDKKAISVTTEQGEIFPADIVVSNADIHHTETVLLQKQDQSFSQKYWKKRTLAPSAFIMYLGVNKTLPQLKHHTLYFAQDWKKNFSDIFDHPSYPDDPSFYICNSNKTDKSTAPAGKENLFILVPIAPGLEDTKHLRAQYGKKIITKIETMIGDSFAENIECLEYFSVKDFESRYHSFQGSALGLAHTLKQTAAFRPDTKSKKVKNLYYVGGNTNPGIGMPMCLISAELVYKQLTGDTSNKHLTKITT